MGNESIPSVAAVNFSSALPCSAAGCIHTFNINRRSLSINPFNAAGNSVIGSAASTPVACTTPADAASSLIPVYFSMRRSRDGKKRISLYVRGSAACGASATTINAAPGSVHPVR